MKAIDYVVKLHVESAAARDLTTGRTGDAFAYMGVDVVHPKCVGQCGYYRYSSNSPTYLATDFDGVGASQLLFSPWYRPPGVTTTRDAPVTIKFRFQRHDGQLLPAAAMRISVPVHAIAAMGNYEAPPVGGLPLPLWLPDQGGAFAAAKLRVVSIAATPVL